MAWIRYHVAYSFVFVQPLAKSSPVGISECRMSWKSIWGKFTASAYWRHLWTARPNTSDFLKPKACASFRTLAVFIDGDWRFPLIFPTETTSVKQSPVASWRNKPKFIKKKIDVIVSGLTAIFSCTNTKQSRHYCTDYSPPTFVYCSIYSIGITWSHLIFFRNLLRAGVKIRIRALTSTTAPTASTLKPFCITNQLIVLTVHSA